MRTIREEPQNIATYDIQGLGLQHIVSKESYGLYPPVVVNSIRNLSSIENRDYNLRLRILDWDLQDRGHGTVEAMWNVDLSSDQMLELLQHHRVNIIWQHVFTNNSNNSDYQDEDYSEFEDDIQEDEEVVQETHDSEEIVEGNNPEENNNVPLITINLTLRNRE